MKEKNTIAAKVYSSEKRDFPLTVFCRTKGNICGCCLNVSSGSFFLVSTLIKLYVAGGESSKQTELSQRKVIHEKVSLLPSLEHRLFTVALMRDVAADKMLLLFIRRWLFT